MSFLGYCSKEYKDDRGREYYFDNAKFILILLVVLGHAISPLQIISKKVEAVWTVINSLHMPCMILISGYFAKSYIKNGMVKTQRLLTYIVYYVAAQIAVSLFEYFVLGYAGKMDISMVYPRTSLWYLMCLCWWFLVLPYVTKLKPKYLLVFSLIFAFVLGYDTRSASVLSLMRAINHFPFFLIGYYFKAEWLYKFRNKVTQILSVCVIAVITLLTYFNLDIVPTKIITSQYSYNRCDLKVLNDTPVMFLNRAIFYIVALLLCASFMLLVPRGKAFFTRFGSRTLQVYILHRFLYLSETEYKWYEPFKSTKGFFAMCLIAVAVTFILSLKPFEYPFKWLSKIKLKRFKRA